ncbi:MAG TPA: recombinase family protein [Symbiobacteriaceae bacterium]|nr:recombinase family protein [Symbiobacteriaceae bacterium]
MSSLYTLAVDPGRVAVYIRWSTEEQSEGTTLQVQQEACEHYVRAQGWQFRPDLVFVDDGYSGGTMDRPGLTALRRTVKDGKVTCVVVFKLDRLSRSVLDTVSLVLQEWEGVCYIKSTREPVDTTSPAGKMFFYMLASYAEWERSVIRERTMSGKVKRAQQGKNPGGSAPYGYARGDRPGEVVVHEQEAAIVRRIFAEYAAGRGLHQIAAGLNQTGAKPRRSTRWFPTTIAQMLANPLYLGVREYGRTTLVPPNLRRTVGKRRLAFAEPRYARVEGAVPAIVPAQLAEQVRRVQASKAGVAGRRALAPDFLLTGIARCRCGAGLRGDSRASRGLRYYRCMNAAASHPAPCPSGLIPAAELEAAVVEQVRRVFDPANLEQYLAGWESELMRQRAEAEARLAAVREAGAVLLRKRAKLDADYDAGDLPAKLYAERVEWLEQEQAGLAGQEAEALQGRESARRAPVDLAEYRALGAAVDAWDHLSPEERKQLLRFALDTCIVWRSPARGTPGVRPTVEVALTVMHTWCKVGIMPD